MPDHKRVEPFETYLNRMVNALDITESDKKELLEEWRQHLYEALDARIERGMEKEKAVQEVLKQFGDPDMLQEQVNQVYPSFWKQHVQKEAVIWSLILLAALTGPSLLIGAHFRVYFITVPLTTLLLGYVVYHFFLKRISHPLLALVVVPPVYLYFIYLFYVSMGKPWTPGVHLEQMFSVRWDELTGLDGIFTYPSLHMLWYGVILWKWVTLKHGQSFWQVVGKASTEYWLFALIGVWMARLAPSAEWGVFQMNVLLLYGFLQQIISPSGLVVWKNRVAYWIKREI
ncbi:MAG: hypothetical protein H0Z33_08680 [Bacillaceae bacterium]|nr:hypothetical protein [Bacillaceae bacterium]